MSGVVPYSIYLHENVMDARSDADPANILTNPGDDRYVRAPAYLSRLPHMCLSPAIASRRGFAACLAAAALLAGARAARPQAAPTVPLGGPQAGVPHLPTPAVVRGLYVNRWAALSDKVWALIRVGETTEVNALVIDVKDDRGLLLYRSAVPLARAIGADTVSPMRSTRVRALLDTMRAHGVYAIARIVVAKDPLLATHKSDWAIRERSDTAALWHDRQGRPWLDPTQRGVWQYAVDIAREAAGLGFSEIQFDYVRFPDDKRLVTDAVFPLAQGRKRADVIHDQLAFAHGELKPLQVPLAIDVFGLTASDSTDMGIGQRWEAFVAEADIVQPMSYPSHYAPGTYHLAHPNAHPYDVVAHTLDDAARRSATVSGAAPVRPWYQDFTLGPPRYGVAQVRAQIQAGYDKGIMSWLLWNPGSRYTLGALEPRSALEMAIGKVARDSGSATPRAP